MASVERLVDVGIKPQNLVQDVPKERQLDALMERLRSKASHFKSWSENAKALRTALVDKRNILDANERVQLQKCLDSLQKSIKVTSLQSMVERLESISRQLGLKFTAGPTGTDCFISSDMFYVEVLLEATGTVKDVKIAHHGDPVSCPELSEVLSNGDFVEFTKHLEGLSAIYQLNADKKQKSKAYMALQALETDLTMLSQLQSSINDPGNLVHKSPVGILETRRGGHPMKLTYFISPYDLLDLDSKTLIPLSVDAVIEKQLGYSVMVCIESSMSHKLQTQSLMSISRTTEGKSLPSFAAPSNLNSTTLPASFVLRLNSPMPIAVALVRKIQAITHIDCADLSTNQPLLALITQRASKGEIDSHSGGLFVTLPDQHHCYFMSGSNDLQGTMITSIPFTHPTHVPQILIFLRQQALFNVLVSSCIRPHSRQDLESALMFEISALSWLHVSVAFEHPIEESMATAEFDLSDITNVKCKLHTMPNDTPICSDEYASKVAQRCLSVPITMRALIRKAQGQQQQRFGQTNGDMSINLVSNNGNGGNLLGHPSPFSDGSSGAGGGGGGGSSSSKFVTDFDVKLNGHNGGGGDGGMSDMAPILPKLEPGLSSSSSSSYSGVSAELGRSALGGLDAATGFLDSGGGSSSHLQHSSATSTSSSSINNTHGDLFSLPPERAGSLTSSTLLGNVLPQAGAQQQPPPTPLHPIPVPKPSSLPSMPQGKPNAMLMNLLNDIPQGQPLNVGSGVSITASPATAPPPASLPGGSLSSSAGPAIVKPRKQRKRKAIGDLTSPRSSSGSVTGRSPKRKASEDDGGSKDLPTPTADTGDSNMAFDTATSGHGVSFSLVTGGATITTTTTTVAGGVSSFSISGSAADIHALKSSIGDAAFNRFRKSPTAAGRSADQSLLAASSDSLGYQSGGVSVEGMMLSPTNRPATGAAGDFRIKSEPTELEQVNELRTVPEDDTKEGGHEFTLDGGSFTISAGSSVKLSAAPSVARTGASSSQDRSSKDASKKIKKLKLELGGIHHKSGGGALSGGMGMGERKETKEIEKIPIVLDITSACDSGKPSEVTVMRPPSSVDLPDRRPSVEIIPLGSGGTTPSSSSPMGGPPTSSLLQHHHSTGLNLYNATSIKISKSPALMDAGAASKKDSKLKQRELRKMTSTNNDILDKKSGMKLESKKERKRKRMEDLLDGMSVEMGGPRPPKIINVTTQGPTMSGAGHSGLTVALDSKGVPVVSQQRSLALPNMSRPVTSSSGATSHKSPLLSPPLNSAGLSLSVSKALTAMSAASSIGSTASSKKSTVSSPTVSPTLAVSPNKSVSILKATHSSPGSMSKPKSSSINKPGASGGSGSGGIQKSSSVHGEQGSSGGSKLDVNNTRVTISPLKVHNKNQQGLLPIGSASKSVSGQSPTQQSGSQHLPSNKPPTRPASVKLKQLNLPQLPTSGAVVCGALTSPRGSSSPTVSSKSSASAALLTMVATNSLSNVSNAVTSSCGSLLPSSVSSGQSHAGSSPTSALSVTMTSVSPSATSGLALSPSSASKLQAMTQGNSTNAVTAAAMAALLAQKASKLAARSRKGSLSAVIDKLMASSMQNTGDVPLPPPSTSDVPKRAESGGSAPTEKNRSEKRDSLGSGGASQKGSGESRTPKGGGGGGGGGGSSDGKALLEGGKKAEFTVKQSSQGIKLTVTKTHTTEGVTKLSSSLKGSGKLGRSSGSGGAGGGGSNSNKFPGSSTGLKPGVNSGPASKKGSTSPALPVVAATATTMTTSSTTTKSPSSNPGSTQSAKGPGLLSPKVLMTPGSVPTSPTLSAATVMSAATAAGTLPSMSVLPVSTSSKSSSSTSSTATVTSKSQQGRHQGSELRPSSSGGGGTGSKSQEKGVSKSGSGGVSGTETLVRPTTPKINSAAPSLTMPPPPPPPATSEQMTTAATSTMSMGSAIRKSREDSPQRHSPVRQMSSKTSLVQSPTGSLDESDSERAFQRLLQVQGAAAGSSSNQVPGSGSVSRKPQQSNIDSLVSASSLGGGGNSKLDGARPQAAVSGSKTEPEHSPKHSSSSADGRTTPKSSATAGAEKNRAPSPSVGAFSAGSTMSSALISKMTHQIESKRPMTPKLDMVTSASSSTVSLAKSDSAIAMGNISLPSSSPQPSNVHPGSGMPMPAALAAPSATVKSASSKSVSIGGKSKMTPPPSNHPESPGAKEIHSPEDRLIIDYPMAPVARRQSPDPKALTKPATLPPPPPPPVGELSLSGSCSFVGKSISGILGGSSSSAFSSLIPSSAATSAVDMRITTPTSPVLAQPLKSPAQPSPMVRSPVVVSTPQSEHSNPSSVAHSSPYDIDDELMDEALVGLGK